MATIRLNNSYFLKFIICEKLNKIARLSFLINSLLFDGHNKFGIKTTNEQKMTFNYAMHMHLITHGDYI